MDFFAYAPDPVMYGKTLCALSELGSKEYRQRMFALGRSTAPSSMGSMEIEHTLEIVTHGMRKGSRISENLNLYAYSARAKENDKRNQYRVDQKTFHILNQEKSEDGYDVHVQRTLPSHVLSSGEGGYESVEVELSAKESVRYMRKNRKNILLEHGVDPIVALARMNDNLDAQENIQMLYRKDIGFRKVMDSIRHVASIPTVDITIPSLFVPYVDEVFI